MALTEHLPSDGAFWASFKRDNPRVRAEQMRAQHRHQLNLPAPPVFRHRRPLG